MEKPVFTKLQMNPILMSVWEDMSQEEQNRIREMDKALKRYNYHLSKLEKMWAEEGAYERA